MARDPLSWHVAPEEAPRRPPPDASPVEPAPSRRRWLGLALAAGIVLLVLVAQMRRAADEARRERAALIVALGDHVVAEAQAMAAGQPGAAANWMDPAAVADWAVRYRRLFEPAPVNPYNELCGVYGTEWHPNAARPALTLVNLAGPPGARRAVLRVAWAEGSAATEPRAYREVDGGWRRTPLTKAEITRGAWRELVLGAWRVVGPAGDLRVLTTPTGPGVDFARLDEQVRQDVPRAASAVLSAGRVVVQPTELESPVIEVGIAPEPRVVVNSPELALVNPDGPLSAGALYRLALVTSAASARYGQLGAAELPFGPFWALDDAERKAVRNHLRGVLDGAWRSQLAEEDAPVNEDRAPYERWQRGCISDALLVQQLLATRRVESLAELIGRMDQANDGAAVLLDLSGQPDRAAYERWARDWAVTPEP
jgi:hypothetical protein